MPRRWVAIVAVLAAALVAGASPAFAENDPRPEGYVIVQYATGVQAQSADGSAPTLEEQGFRHVPIPKGKTAAQFIAELQQQPNVLSVENDAPIFQAAEIPDDPYYLRDQASYLTQIGAPAAWDLTQGNGTVVVAVLDSGIDLSHPEFRGRLWENPADAYSDGIDHDGNGCINDRYGCNFVSLTQANGKICGYTNSIHNGNVMDDSGPPHTANGAGSHGTFVAGIVGAAGDNNEGIAGVGWNIKLMTVKVLDCGSEAGGLPSGRPFEVAQGIEYAVKMGANIINLSLAVRPDEPGADSPAVRRAIESARAAGVLIVAAAGNHSGSDAVGTGYPAAYTEYPNVIAVGASNNLDNNTWAPYSNYGPAIDFAAPGDQIASTIRSDLPGIKVPYGTASGTSMATPLVSGMFALMMSRNSRLGLQEYVDIAKATATPAAPAPHGQNWAGAGIINIGAAVQRLPMSISGSALKDWKDVPAGTDVRAFIDGNECGSTTTTAFGIVSRYSIRVKSAAEKAGCGAPGKLVQLTVNGQTAYPSFTWGGVNEDLAVASKDVSSISPPPGAVVVQTLGSGWSNIAFFDQTTSPSNGLSQLPAPWSAAYHWNPEKLALTLGLGAYERYIRNVPFPVSDWLVVKQYDTFWVDAPPGNLASLNPNPAPGRIAQFKPGWNSFVYTGSSKEVKDALSSIAGKYTEVLQYDNATQKWLLYIPGQPRYLNDFGGLFKLKIYWIYMTDSAAISMD
ncbi:MAG: S8 family serine peptidase [Dehalococcoidia bacterium]|nr:S8 family serine peptidase [Dehalococcoidia bacterium]